MEKRGPLGNKVNKVWGAGFTGVVGHSVSSSSSLHSRRGGLVTQSQAPGLQQGRLQAPPPFFSVPLKHSLPQKETHPPFSAGGGDTSSTLKDERIRGLEGRVKFLENQISAGSLSKQLSNMNDELCEAKKALRIKEESLQAVNQESETLRDVFLELRQQFRETQERLEILQEEGRPVKTEKKSRKGRRSARKGNEEAETEAAKAAAETKTKLESRIAKLEKDILSYQEDFLENILRPTTSTSSSKTSRGGSAIHMTPSSTDMHSFLRQTIQKLKEEVNSLSGERQSLKSQSEGKSIECLRLEKELKASQEDLKRLQTSVSRLEEQNQVLQEERDSLRSHFKETIVPQLESEVESLKKSVDSLERQLENTKQESAEELERLEREVVIERDKADILLAQGVEEREGAEGRWRERWEEHTERMKEEMVALRKEFEEPLRTAHVREERLRLALAEVEERYERSKAAWELYRKDLFDQVSEWKGRFSQKVELLETLRAGKIEMETLLQKKLEEVTVCHEMVRRGVEERQELEKRLEDLEERLQRRQETPHHSSANEEVGRSAGEGVTEDDLAALQAKMVQDAHAVAVAAAKSSSPPPPPTQHLPSTSTPPTITAIKSNSKNSSKSTKPDLPQTQMFTVGGSTSSSTRRKSPGSNKSSSKVKQSRRHPQ